MRVAFEPSQDTAESGDQYSPADLEYLIFDICSGCKKLQMASVPQGAYAAWKVHSNMMKNSSYECTSLAVKKAESDKTMPPIYHFPQGNKKFLDHPPAKYNSKMMNSIWGLYNRYSVHNLKKITDGDDANEVGVQQLNTAATPASPKGGLFSGPQAIAPWEVFLSGHTY